MEDTLNLAQPANKAKGSGPIRDLGIYDPFRLGPHIEELPHLYVGSLTKTTAAAQASLGLIPYRHPHIQSRLSPRDARGGGSLLNEERPAQVQAIAIAGARRFFDGITDAGIQSLVEKTITQPTNVRRAVRVVCATTTHQSAWTGFTGQTHIDTVLTESAAEFERSPNFQSNLAIGPIYSGLRNMQIPLGDATSELIDESFASDDALANGGFYIADRAHQISRMILGSYDFYGIKHDKENPYLIEPPQAIKANLTPALNDRANTALQSFLDAAHAAHPHILKRQAGLGGVPQGLPNPWYMLMPGDLPDNIRSLMHQATSPTVSPRYRHPTLSQDYGRLPWLPNAGSTPLYMSTTTGSTNPSGRGRPLVDNGMHFSGVHPIGDDPFSSGHLCHTSWIDDASLAALSARPKNEFTLLKQPDGLNTFQGYLPVDQVINACAITIHSSDLGLIEAAQALNPMALCAAAHLSGVDETIIRTYLATWSIVNNEPSAWGDLVAPMEGSPGPSQLADATRLVLSEFCKKHVTNILRRHPQLLDPSVGAPMVVMPTSLQVTPAGQMFVSEMMTTLVPSLMLANIELPVEAEFANHPCVKAGLGDRSPEQMVPAKSSERKPYRVATGRVLGCPFVTGSICEEDRVPTDYLHPSDPRKSQVYNAFCWLAAQNSAYLMPTDFLASVFELNTHTNEFIQYQDEFMRYMRDLEAGVKAAPPTTSPFQVVGQTLWSPKYTALPSSANPHMPVSNATASTDRFKSENALFVNDDETFIWSQAGGEQTTPIAYMLKNYRAPFMAHAAIGLANDGSLEPDMRPVNLTAPVYEGLTEKLQRAHEMEGLPFEARDTPYAASYLRLLRAVKCNVAGGVVTGQGAKDILSPTGINESMAVTGTNIKAGAGLSYGTGVVRTRAGAVRATLAHGVYNCFKYDHAIDGMFTFRDDARFGQMLNAAYDGALNQASQLSYLGTHENLADTSSVERREVEADFVPKTFYRQFGVASIAAIDPGARKIVKEVDPYFTSPSVPILKLGVLPAIDDLSIGGYGKSKSKNPFASRSASMGFDARSIISSSGPTIPVAHWNNLTRHGAGPLFTSSQPSTKKQERLETLSDELNAGFEVSSYKLPQTETPPEAHFSAFEQALQSTRTADASIPGISVQESIAQMIDDRALVGVPHLSASPLFVVERGGRDKGKGRAAIVAVGAFATTARGPASDFLMSIKAHSAILQDTQAPPTSTPARQSKEAGLSPFMHLLAFLRRTFGDITYASYSFIESCPRP